MGEPTNIPNEPSIFKRIWFQFTKGLYRHELQLLVIPLICQILLIVYESFYSDSKSNGMVLLGLFLIVIYYLLKLLAYVSIVCWVILPGYFYYTYRNRKALLALKQQPSELWIKKYVHRLLTGKYRAFVILSLVVLGCTVVNSLSIILYPTMPVETNPNARPAIAFPNSNTTLVNSTIPQMDFIQTVSFYSYYASFLGFVVCFLLYGMIVNQKWHPVPDKVMKSNGETPQKIPLDTTEESTSVSHPPSEMDSKKIPSADGQTAVTDTEPKPPEK